MRWEKRDAASRSLPVIYSTSLARLLVILFLLQGSTVAQWYWWMRRLGSFCTPSRLKLYILKYLLCLSSLALTVWGLAAQPQPVSTSASRRRLLAAINSLMVIPNIIYKLNRTGEVKFDCNYSAYMHNCNGIPCTVNSQACSQLIPLQLW